MSEKKHKVHHRVIKHVHKRGPKVKIKTDGKMKRVSFTTSRPKWGAKYSFVE